jgi:hypothetical protein
MLDIPNELLLMISTHLDHRDLRALATSSQTMCFLLLPEYLRRRGLLLKDTKGASAELRDSGGYTSLGLWSVARIFHPPEDMYCPIPYDAQEARSAMRFLVRFLQEPSNTCNLQSFHISFHSDPYLVGSELCQIQRLFRVLPLRELYISGFCSADHLSPPITLRRGWSFGSRTLTSITISSDHAFTPGLVRTTMGILKNSPIKSLRIYMVSLNLSQWSTLFGELSMTFLEDIEVEGDIPRPALIRFLINHKGLKRICIRGNVTSDRALPGRSWRQHIFPSLQILRAPLEICCDILERASDPSDLFEVEVEVSRLHPFDPLFLRFVEILWRFRKLDNLGLRVRPSPQSVTPVTSQESPNDHNWVGHPAGRLRQVRTLSFMQAWCRLSPGDIVCPHLLSLISLTSFP